MQLMQVYSQKSTSTTLPFSSFLSDRGPLLNQAWFPAKSGAGVPGVSSAPARGDAAKESTAAAIAEKSMLRWVTEPPWKRAVRLGSSFALYAAEMAL